MSKFSIEQLEGVFIVKGSIDEKSDLSKLTRCEDPEITINLKGVNRIGSYGIKNWILMLAKLQGKKIIYQECSPAFVEQMNLIVKMIEGVEVESFLLPFICHPCQKEVSYLVSFSAAQDEKFMENLDHIFTCEICKEHMEFNDWPEEYFGFMDKAS